MATITTRAGKGSPLTNNEVDANFTNLNTDKAETDGATLTNVDVNSGAIDGTAVGATTPSTGDFTTLTENDSPAVVQSDIGTDPDEIPLNQYLGSMAYQDAENVSVDNIWVNGTVNTDLVMAAGKGIDFSASEGGGASASVLDDYEEGTWTPVVTGSTSGSAVLNAGQSLFAYTKVGRVVHIQGQVVINSETFPSTGYLEISLPFVVETGPHLSEVSAVSVWINGSSINVADWVASNLSGEAAMAVYRADGSTISAGNTNLDPITAGDSIAINGSYITS